MPTPGSSASILEAIGNTTVVQLQRIAPPNAANVAAALALAVELGPQATIVTVACNSCLKYLPGDLYSGVTPNAT
jgi:cysteine synthase